MNRAAYAALLGGLVALCFSTLAWPFNPADPSSQGGRGAGKFRSAPALSASSSSLSPAASSTAAPVPVVPAPAASSVEASPPPSASAEAAPGAPPAPRRPSFWVGLELSHQEVPRQMLGDAEAILEELGLLNELEKAKTSTTVPRLKLSFDLSSGPKHTLGIDGGLSWMSTSISSGSSRPITYRASRHLIPIDTLGRFSVGTPDFSVFAAAGLSLGLTAFDEQGWLGDDSSIAPTIGLVLRSGMLIRLNPLFRLSAGVLFQTHSLPQANPLILDGGTAQSKGLFAGLEFAP